MIISDVLRSIHDLVAPGARRMGLTRQRGGLIRGVHWLELAGRGTDGSWYEIRLHHNDRTGELKGGMLRYRPMGQGGRTDVVGEIAYEADESPSVLAMHMAEEIGYWIDLANVVRPQTGRQSP